MAEQLAHYFNEAKKLGGLPATIRLATLTRISSIEAKASPDDLKTLNIVKKGYETLIQEFKGNESDRSSDIQEDEIKAVEKLRNYIQVFSDLTSTKSMYQQDIKATAKRITEAIAAALDVERASLWMYYDNQSAIKCLDLFEKSKNEHSEGTVLNKADFPNYFKTIASSRTLSAEDAHSHPGTSEFSEVYLKPLGIVSMLDVPIFANGEMIGVVCHEQTGSKRKWTKDEENFAYLMGNMVGMSIERSKATA